MNISIADALAAILAEPPVPVLFLDTCNFLNLFRADESPFQPRSPQDEIRAATELLSLACTIPRAVHLIVPELIPREYNDHANAIQAKFTDWLAHHDHYQEWLFQVALSIGATLPQPRPVLTSGMADRLCTLADNLLAQARILNRDPDCLNRAVFRLVNKTRPSHKKEMKDSMNLEQCLELSRRLHQAGYSRSRVWVSSNTRDFAQQVVSSQLHQDLQGDLAAAGLKYFPFLRSTLGHLRSLQEL